MRVDAGLASIPRAGATPTWRRAGLRAVPNLAEERRILRLVTRQK